MQKRLLLGLVLVACFLLASCDDIPPDALAATLTAQPDLIQRVNQRTESVLIDTIPVTLDNIGNASPVSTEIERERATTTTVEVVASVEIGAEVTEIIKAGIALEFGVTQEQMVASRQSFTLTAEADTRVDYVIDWYETWQVGDLLAPDLQAELHYRVRTGIRGSLRVAGPEETEAIAALTLALPAGHVLYDDFSSPDSFASWWWVNDEFGMCDFTTVQGSLTFACENAADADRGATLHPNLPAQQLLGVATALQVTRTGGPMQLSTNWINTSTGATERAYQLLLQPQMVEAVECFPEEGWRCELLYRGPVSAGEAHVVQIEHQPDGLAFLVDGQPLSLTTQPAWSDSFVMRDWNLPFWLWPEHGIEGQLDWISSRDVVSGSN